MRSRPNLTVLISPEKPRPGDRLRVVAKLESKSDTPTEGTIFRLEGTERRYSHTSSSGNTTSAQYKSHSVFALEARTDPAVLHTGSYRHEATFPIPTDAPPSFDGRLGSVKYALDVRVSIPWWPDRRESYEVKILAPSWRATPQGPKVYATHVEGPAPGEPYIEATVDPMAAFLGGELVGAVSYANLKKRTKRAKLALVAVDVAHFDSSTREGEVRRYEWELTEGKPEEGARIPFRVQLPADEVPSFGAQLFHVVWKLEFIAEVSLGSDSKLAVPISLAPEGAFEGAEAALRRLPPVGHERRAKVWARIAGEHGLRNDADGETMTTRVGGTEVTIHLEQRGDRGLFSVAYVDWPDLGIGLHVTEKKWTDAFRARVSLGDQPFEGRFALKAREQEQAAAFLRTKLRTALAGLHEVAADDAGVMLAAPGGGHKLETLDAFVRSVLEVARAADKNASRVPPPRAMADHLPAWRAFAATTRARFEVGSMSLEGASFEGARFDVRTEWGDQSSPTHTTVSIQLAPGADPELDAAVAAMEAARKWLRSLEVGKGELRVKLPAPVTDPATLRETFGALAKVAQACVPGGSRLGPYR